MKLGFIMAWMLATVMLSLFVLLDGKINKTKDIVVMTFIITAMVSLFVFVLVTFGEIVLWQ